MNNELKDVPEKDRYLVSLKKAKEICDEDVSYCKKIGEFGSKIIIDYLNQANKKEIDFTDSKINMQAVLSLIKNRLVKSVHDCSKGGFAIAISELSIFGNIGCNVDIENIPCTENLNPEKILFGPKFNQNLMNFQ